MCEQMTPAAFSRDLDLPPPLRYICVLHFSKVDFLRGMETRPFLSQTLCKV